MTKESRWFYNYCIHWYPLGKFPYWSLSHIHVEGIGNSWASRGSKRLKGSTKNLRSTIGILRRKRLSKKIPYIGEEWISSGTTHLKVYQYWGQYGSKNLWRDWSTNTEKAVRAKAMQGRISKQQLYVQPHAAVKMAMVYVQFFFFLLASVVSGG